jgi:hypothetical protein
VADGTFEVGQGPMPTSLKGRAAPLGERTLP